MKWQGMRKMREEDEKQIKTKQDKTNKNVTQNVRNLLNEMSTEVENVSVKLCARVIQTLRYNVVYLQIKLKTQK